MTIKIPIIKIAFKSGKVIMPECAVPIKKSGEIKMLEA